MVSKTKILSNTHTLVVSKKCENLNIDTQMVPKKMIPDQHWSQLLAHVWSGPKFKGPKLAQMRHIWDALTTSLHEGKFLKHT